MKQRICKVKGCDRKYHALGYCKIHYNKQRYKNNPDYFKNKVHIPTLGVRGVKQTCYTNGVTEEIKKSGFVQKEKERILKDCIKRPWKYLKDDK